VVSKVPLGTVVEQASAATCPGTLGEHDWARAPSGTISANAKADALDRSSGRKGKMVEVPCLGLGQVIRGIGLPGLV
jgi:hypothetical protein